jgi:hypothetical protein
MTKLLIKYLKGTKIRSRISTNESKAKTPTPNESRNSAARQLQQTRHIQTEKKPHKARTDKPPNKTPSSTNFESQHSTMANDVTKASK